MWLPSRSRYVPLWTNPVDVLLSERISFFDLVGSINNVWFFCWCFSQNVNKGNSHCMWHKVTNHEEGAIVLICFWGWTTEKWRCFSSVPSVISVGTLRFSTKYTNTLFRCKCVSEEEILIIAILNVFFLNLFRYVKLKKYIYEPGEEIMYSLTFNLTLVFKVNLNWTVLEYVNVYCVYTYVLKIRHR